MIALSNKLKLKRQLEYEEQAFQDLSGVSRLLGALLQVPSTALGKAGWEPGLNVETQADREGLSEQAGPASSQRSLGLGSLASPSMSSLPHAGGSTRQQHLTLDVEKNEESQGWWDLLFDAGQAA